MIQLRTQMRTELTGGYDIHAEENFVVEQITREVVLSEKEETVRMM